MWLKVNERIQFKIISQTCKVFQTNEPVNLRNFLTIQSLWGKVELNWVVLGTVNNTILIQYSASVSV
jgi:hypothetical protein